MKKDSICFVVYRRTCNGKWERLTSFDNKNDATNYAINSYECRHLKMSDTKIELEFR